ncbi:hypothetical protein E2C01_024688 [Portunus trituberculatus]|uniref:Uncharacterized protein n=1 Tax=Portunus trituberculatus TaxID=210409 RepID=A0A5B7EAZ3_PORTR|nr:hypothetical protein [Portunus trituberculatus]
MRCGVGVVSVLRRNSVWWLGFNERVMRCGVGMSKSKVCESVPALESLSTSLTCHVALLQLVLLAPHHIKVWFVHHCHGHADPALVARVNLNDLDGRDRVTGLRKLSPLFLSILSPTLSLPSTHLPHGSVVWLAQHEDLGARGEVLLGREVHLVPVGVYTNVLHNGLQGVRLHHFGPHLLQRHLATLPCDVPETRSVGVGVSVGAQVL